MISLLNSASFSYPKDIARGNQDSFITPVKRGTGFVFAVADGVGSYVGAKEAAVSAVDYLARLTEFELREPKNVLLGARDKVIELSESYPEYSKSATTFSYCFLDEHDLHIGHVGDTRIYIRKNNKLQVLTKDHTQHQELVDEGIYTKKELISLPGRNALTSALSRSVELKSQELIIPLSELIDNNGLINIYIMSDGAHSFWEKRPRFSPETLLKSPRFASSLQRRIENNGPIDDYTLVCASFTLN